MNNTERYKQGKIYMIESASTGLIYYGSTCMPLSKRLYGHKSDFKRYKDGRYAYLTSFKVIEQPDYKIVLVEEFPCENKNQLEAREGHFIRNNPCVNKVIPTTPEFKQEQYQLPENKERRSTYHHNYYTAHAQELIDSQKQYYQGNSEKIKERERKRYSNNRDIVIKKYNENRDEILAKNKEPITCSCGQTIARHSKSKHMKSAFHLQYLETLPL